MNQLPPTHAELEPSFHPLRVLVVEDEPPARANVVRLLAQDSRFVTVGEARDGLEALECVESLRPEVLVLDIQMPGLNGFEVLEALAPTSAFSVLFSTASEAHAVRAFDAHAIDYLLKPYTDQRFAMALDKIYVQRLGAVAHSSYDALLVAARPRQRERLVLKTVEGEWIRIASDEVTRISAAKKHVQVVTPTGSYLVRQPIRELAARLDDRFVRVHRSDIVNLEAVVRVEPWEHGDALLVLRNGTTLVLTRTFRASFWARFRGTQPL